MADFNCLLLSSPPTTYLPVTPSPVLAHRRDRAGPLNPIIEEAGEDRPPPLDMSAAVEHGRQRNHQSIHNVKQWLSPTSDHFPTPRGLHFLAAPVMPSTASGVDGNADIDDLSPISSSSRPSTTTNTGDRHSLDTNVTEFDLYDVPDDEARQTRQQLSRRARPTPARALTALQSSLAPLVIPGSPYGRQVFKTVTSPAPPTPPTQVAMSPAAKSMMQAHHSVDVPAISAPPSLDGSLNSEELAAISAPTTPSVDGADEDGVPWSGVRLEPGALATLQALSGNEAVFRDHTQAHAHALGVDLANETMILQSQSRARCPPDTHQEMLEMPHWTFRLGPNVPQAFFAGSSSTCRPSLFGRTRASLSKLDIPSPEVFFSELSSASKRTWQSGAGTGDVAPLTSTTAEQFYKVPWACDSASPPTLPQNCASHSDPNAVIEQVVKVPDTSAQQPSTALRLPWTPEPCTACRVSFVPVPCTATSSPSGISDGELVTASPLVANGIVNSAAPPSPVQKNVASQLDRTEMWLKAQRNYMQGIAGFSDDSEHAPDAPALQPKTVRFSEPMARDAGPPWPLPSSIVRQESAYYRAFADAMVRVQPGDVLVHQQPRFEALQTQRVALRDMHRSQLLGKFQLSVVPQSAKKRMSANVARGDDELVDDPDTLQAEKEAQALDQMSMAHWHVAASRLLGGGRLLTAPVAKRLARPSRLICDDAHGFGRDRARILDLAGMGACDWAWHVALQHPNAHIYTVTTKTMRQLSNSNVRGPPNHRQVAVEHLSKLPFPDAHFDLVSARELHAALKTSGEHGVDEWDACLQECMRVLKPGGYLEFSLLDADIMNAGPLGNAKAVEFGFALQTLGFDPAPTRSFVGRVQRAGFEGLRRVWLCLPMGPRPEACRTPPPASQSRTAAVEAEAMITGSADSMAAVTGLAASWTWERWLLRAEMEKAAGELRLVDMATDSGPAVRQTSKMMANVHSVVEEGRRVGSAFRLLRGYARKPTMLTRRERMGTIKMTLDQDSLR